MHALQVYRIAFAPLAVAAIPLAIWVGRKAGVKLGLLALVVGVNVAGTLGYAAAGIAVIAFGSVR